MATLKLSKKKMTQRSTFVMIMICVVGIGMCIASLVYVQLIRGDEFRETAARNQLQDSIVRAERGIIYDANMHPLAESTSAKIIYIDPKMIGDDEEVRNTIVKTLSEILDLSPEYVRERTLRTSNSYIEIRTRVDNDIAEKVREFNKSNFVMRKNDEGEMVKRYYSEYIGISPDVKRYYSNPLLASSVLGFINRDYNGAYGVEEQYNSVLTGVPGRIITAKNGNSESPMPIEYKSVYDPQRGSGLVLTIDEYIQSYLEKGLQQAYTDTKCDTALGIIMDVDTGAILGMGSRGAGYFDLSDYNALADANASAEVEAIEDETKREQAFDNAQYRQWRNICISDAYEPGSVFKIFTASALLEEGLVSMDETYTCVGFVQEAGSPYHCHKHEGHGTQNIAAALKNSCNPFFITRGIRLGVNGFNKYIEAFGFLNRTGIDLPSEANSVYFDISKMTLSNVASASFGQTLNVTPIQILAATSCIANGGKLMKPYVVAKQLDADGNILSETKPTVRRQVLSEETSKKMREMMEGVVKEGSGKNAYVAGYRVAGKTGTSLNVNKERKTGVAEYWASFACFAPSNDPKVAMIVVLYNPKGAHGGGAVAAPVAASVLENVMPYLNVEPQYTEKELASMEIEAKNVIGRPVAEARETLLANGFTVKVRGDGDTVISQIPAGGQKVPQNGAIILYTSKESTNDTTEMPNLVGLSVNEATNKALAAGINIKIAGNSLMSSELFCYKQGVEPGTKVSYGTTVTAYFKSNTNIEDD